LQYAPAELDNFMATAMAKEPTQRFRQPLALANAYHHIVAPQDTERPPLAVASSLAVLPPLVTPPIVPKSNASARRPARRPARGTTISRRRVLITIVIGGGAIAAVTAVGLFGSHFLSGTTSTATTSNTPTANSSGSTATTSKQPTTSTTSSPPATGHTGTVIAKTTDIPVNGSKTFPIANQTNPGIIVHLVSNSFVAFDSTCTHAGCAVSYNATDKLLECPCHGASFDPAKNAAVVQGPAQTPLAPIKITVNADNTITTG
jgi:eukaryotic-like serine/threonine-protein kinase